MPRGRRDPYGLELRARKPLLLDTVPVEQWTWTPHDPRGVTIASMPSDEFPNAVQTNYRPRLRRQRVVLVFDVGALNRGLLEHLRKERVRYFYLDYVELMQHGAVSLNIGGKAGSHGTLSFG